jgi:hypothetical protein
MAIQRNRPVRKSKSLARNRLSQYKSCRLKGSRCKTKPIRQIYNSESDDDVKEDKFKPGKYLISKLLEYHVPKGLWIQPRRNDKWLKIKHYEIYSEYSMRVWCHGTNVFYTMEEMLRCYAWKSSNKEMLWMFTPKEFPEAEERSVTFAETVAKLLVQTPDKYVMTLDGPMRNSKAMCDAGVPAKQIIIIEMRRATLDIKTRTFRYI